jgi:hypothetical protein
MKHDIEPIKLDILNLRQERQAKNDKLCLKSLSNKDLSKNINKKSFELVLKILDLSACQILNKCEKDAYFAKLLASKVSISASRQGVKDEILQINCCNNTSSKFGIFFNKLDSNEFRPSKNGGIVSSTQMKHLNISKNDCLKSFDAKIDGKINGWLFAKIVIGNGGHQDNVFEEASQICEWVQNFGCEKELYVVLIDTDNLTKLQKLQEKFQSVNLLVGNHITVQNYFIQNYSL